MSDRFYRPEREIPSHRVLWTVVNALLLGCLIFGLLILICTGFRVPTEIWFYPAVGVVCLALAAAFQSDFCRKYWPGFLLGAVLLYILLLYLNQAAFLTGMRQFGNLIIETLNRVYSGDLQGLDRTGGADRAQVFLLFVSIPMLAWLSVGLFKANIQLMISVLIFPLLILLMLCGAAGNIPGLFLLTFGIVLSMAFNRPRRQYRMWGGKNEVLRQSNKRRYELIQKKSMLAVLLAGIILSVPGFFLVRPFLSFTLKPAEAISTQVQSQFLNRALKFLPQISAGQWNLNLDAIGGGVQDGSLNNQDGYLLEGVEDLRLTVTKKPTESIFLKGFIGTEYQDGAWVAGYGSNFDGAAINWNTSGSPRLYIQNLPFLRTTYASAQGSNENPEIAEAMQNLFLEPVQLFVERLNANDKYTYVPYDAYLNTYYTVEAGDGTVTGQSEQEDRYYFFYRGDAEEVLTVWNELETANVLDRTEESYAAFCESAYSKAPEHMNVLREEIAALMKENKWSVRENLDEITSWIRQYLAENYHYELNPAAPPEGVDALDDFLYGSKEGNSVHFASAAVFLYRMFGVPARYVVGYEVPSPLFTAQAGGIYTATIQGDNSQAWVEIYERGLGWMPKDMTPGVIGTYEEVGPGGEKIEAEIVDEESEEKPKESETVEDIPEGETGEKEETSIWKPFKEITLMQVITMFLWIAVAVTVLAAALRISYVVCRNNGYDPFKRRTVERRVTGIFGAIFRRLRRLGLPTELDSQSPQFVSFFEDELEKRVPEDVVKAAPLIETIYRGVYGNGHLTEAEVLCCRQLYRDLWKRSKRQ